MSLLALALLAAHAPLTIDIANVPATKGRVRVDVCPKEKFLEDGCAWHTTVPARAGTVSITIPDLPPGDYAVQAFHDANGNDEMDRGMFGIPKEAFGFSRDAKVVMSPPKWQDAMFRHDGTGQRILLHLHKWGSSPK